MRSRSLGRALACPARSEHSRKQPQGPRAWVGGDPGVQASSTPAAFSRGTGGGDVISSSCLTCPSSLPPSASHPSKAVTCTGVGGVGVLWRWAEPLLQGTLGFQRLWKDIFLWSGCALPPTAYVTGFLPPTGGCPLPLLRCQGGDYLYPTQGPHTAWGPPAPE